MSVKLLTWIRSALNTATGTLQNIIVLDGEGNFTKAPASIIPDVSGFLTQAEIEALPGFGGSGGASLPAGFGGMWFSSVAPSGWYLLDGQPVDESLTIGAWRLANGGVSNGDGTVNLPDMRLRIPMMMGTGYSLHDLAGEAEHTLSAHELPTSVPIHGGLVPVGWGGGYNVESPASFGGGLAHNNIPPVYIINFIVFGG